MKPADAATLPAPGKTPTRRFDPRDLLASAGWMKWAAPIATPFVIWLLLPVFAIDQQAVITRATPFILTALAVALPARAGLINVGGEGQLLIGAAAAGAFAKFAGDGIPLIAMVPLMMLAGAIGGLLWSGIAATLKNAFAVNETISTLLLNYVATLFLGYLIHGALKDKESFGFAIGEQIPESARLPQFGETTVHFGILIAIAVTAGVWLLIERSRWGFKAQVVGGNPEAARRGGIPVGKTVMVALLLGGGIAGLAGAIELCGIETRLQTGMATGFGYIGFLCSWMVAHRAAWIPAGATLLAAISVYGDNLQIDLGLPASTVYILMAAIVLVVLAYRGSSTGKAISR
ncbi:MAG: ABC transporter permease [Actinobacteria bacterium]|nr:ABC transporter permease [Actinomycetota bacterium]